MNLLSADIKNIDEYNDRLFVFSASGVDVYRKTDWRRVMTASITTTCGCVNNIGIFIGTSNGVYYLPHGLSGVQGTALNLLFNATTTWLLLQDAEIVSMSGHGNDLLICTAAGTDYMPDMVTTAEVYSYADASGCDHAAIDGTRIAYSVASGLHVLSKPSTDWADTDATVLTTASSPAILSNTVQGLAFGADLFIATPAGVSIYDGTTVTNLTSALGAVVDCRFVHPASTATDSAGTLAYATNDGAAGGRFGIYNITAAANETTISGDATTAWSDDDWQSAVYSDGTTATLAIFAQVANISPAPDSAGVRRDWSLYAEITDTLGGVSSVTLTIDGSSVTPTTSAITNGHIVTYTPAAASGYGQQHRVVLSAIDSDGHTVSRSWSFRCVAASGTAATSTAIPQVVVARDIGLSTDEADETYGGVNVLWLDEIQHPLIVTESQAEAVGTQAVDDVTYHQHVRTLLVDRTDTNDDLVSALREGDVFAYTATALGETVKKAEVVAIRQVISQDDDVQYQLVAKHYEAVSL